MFLAAIVKEHAGSVQSAELNSSRISHDGTTTVDAAAVDGTAIEVTSIEVTGVVAVPEDFLGSPAVASRRDARQFRSS